MCRILQPEEFVQFAHYSTASQQDQASNEPKGHNFKETKMRPSVSHFPSKTLSGSD